MAKVSAALDAARATIVPALLSSNVLFIGIIEEAMPVLSRVVSIADELIESSSTKDPAVIAKSSACAFGVAADLTRCVPNARIKLDAITIDNTNCTSDSCAASLQSTRDLIAHINTMSNVGRFGKLIAACNIMLDPNLAIDSMPRDTMTTSLPLSTPNIIDITIEIVRLFSVIDYRLSRAINTFSEGDHTAITVHFDQLNVAIDWLIKALSKKRCGL